MYIHIYIHTYLEVGSKSVRTQLQGLGPLFMNYLLSPLPLQVRIYTEGLGGTLGEGWFGPGGIPGMMVPVLLKLTGLLYRIASFIHSVGYGGLSPGPYMSYSQHCG